MSQQLSPRTSSLKRLPFLLPAADGRITVGSKGRYQRLESVYCGAGPPRILILHSGYLGNLSETSRASSRRTGSVFDTKTPIQETPEHSIEGSLCVEQALGDGVGAAFDDTGELGRMIPGHAELMLRDSFIPVSNIKSVLHLNSGQALDSGYGPIDEPGATAAESPRYRNYQLKLSRGEIDFLTPFSLS
jgi:hypothetical protein